MDDLSTFFNKNILFNRYILQLFHFLFNRSDLNNLFTYFGNFLHWIVLLPNNLSRNILYYPFLLVINDSFGLWSHFCVGTGLVVNDFFLVWYIRDSIFA